jgi:hypothetical protein
MIMTCLCSDCPLEESTEVVWVGSAIKNFAHVEIVGETDLHILVKAVDPGVGELSLRSEEELALDSGVGGELVFTCPVEGQGLSAEAFEFALSVDEDLIGVEGLVAV